MTYRYRVISSDHCVEIVVDSESQIAVTVAYRQFLRLLGAICKNNTFPNGLPPFNVTFQIPRTWKIPFIAVSIG
jgi:hypothetical protein